MLERALSGAGTRASHVEALDKSYLQSGSGKAPRVKRRLRTRIIALEACIAGAPLSKEAAANTGGERNDNRQRPRRFVCRSAF